MADSGRIERRFHILVQGVVQGVGFRPFVYRLAHEHSLMGWVSNRPDGLSIEVQGNWEAIASFLADLEHSAPPQAIVERTQLTEIAPVSESSFRIVASSLDMPTRSGLPSDLATCPECAREIATPAERRYLYPFTNCTNCGPRYSIVEGLPYDRARTSMSEFPMCSACAAEYEDPLDRRFHAQPIACPDCGPRLALLSRSRQMLAQGSEAIADTARRLLEGKIVAIKGLGGFQLLVDATNARAVSELRVRKHREAKPFAVMLANLDEARRLCQLSPTDEVVLGSPQAPIVLLARRMAPLGDGIADEVAPRNPLVGVMIPYTPLHRVLMDAVRKPMVCTSGNLSEEPMCTSEEEAFSRLGAIADVFLVHNRRIVRPVDDSVVQTQGTDIRVLRRARGYAPKPLPFPVRADPILAVGGHLKSTVAVAFEKQAVVSPHIGDLGSAEGVALLERTAWDLVRFFDITPRVIVCDLHPDYPSTRLAERLASRWHARLVRVQHHHAHVAACMAEHGCRDDVLGLSWDGTGFGTDGSIWGGEALLCQAAGFTRLGHLRTFALVGGDAAAREPRRSALGLLHTVGQSLDRAGTWFTASELGALTSVLSKASAATPTSSIGRLFDAVAALAGLRGINQFEGQAAMELQFCANPDHDPADAYPLPLVDRGGMQVADHGPLVRALLGDLARGESVRRISSRFHHALAELACLWACSAHVSRVALTGGCFQNSLLSQLTEQRLLKRGFDVLRPAQIPCNDGGISLGQLLVAAREEAAH